jgi:quinol monooxygenase YgiN
VTCGFLLDRELPSVAVSDDIELTIVTMRFAATESAAEALLSVLSKYVVLTRQADGCRNVDLCNSVIDPRRLHIIQKWDSPEAQRAHFDSQLMVEMAQACEGLLAAKPDIDLLESISAHDLA